MKIFVGNLARETDEKDINVLFSRHGKVNKVKIIRNLFSQTSLGYGFVEMPWIPEAEKALDGLNTFEFKGKKLVVNEATSLPD